MAVRLLCGVIALAATMRANPFLHALSPLDAATGPVVRCAGDGDFLCADGVACVDGARVCDGQPDCRDESDERNCTGAAAERPEEECRSRQNLWCGRCVPAEWRCDGERDCVDGSDEADCEVPCLADWHRCASGLCIHPDWLCDGDVDCPDGDDEHNCTAGRRRCAGGRFECADSGRCLEPRLVCDGHADCADGSDEAGSCTQPCPAAACPKGRQCRPTPAGARRCLCPAGERLDDGGSCRRPPPCAATGGCEYRCREERCSCPHGLQLATDNRSCRLDPAAGEPTLLFADGRALHQLRLRSRRLRTVAVAADGETVLAVAADLASRRSVYWSTDGWRHGARVWRRPDFRRAPVEPLVVSGLQQAVALAWEWVARALYLADAGRRHLAACDWLGHCAVVVARLTGQPLALAVSPQQRALVWSEVSAAGGRVVRVSLDGDPAGRWEVTGLQVPSSLAVDPVGGRLYWADSGDGQLASCRLADGGGRRAVPELMVRRPFSLAVLADTLLWSDVESQEVHSCDKRTGKNRTVVHKHAGHRSLQLAVLHASLQPPLASACAGSRCDHLCLLSAAPAGHRCFCDEQHVLGDDGFSCHPGNSTELVVAGSHLLLDVTLGVLGGQVARQLDHLPARMVTAVAVDFLGSQETDGGPLRLTLLYADSAAGQIYSCDMDTGRRRVLVADHVTTVVALAADPVRGNVYWADSHRGVVQLVRADGRHRRSLLAGLRFLSGLALSVGHRQLFVALGGRTGNIQTLRLDGSRRRQLVSADVLGPASICADDSSGRLFWADAHLGTIESVRYDGGDRRALKRHLAGPLSVAVVGGAVYWTDKDSWDLHWVHKLAVGRRFTQPLAAAGAAGGRGRPLLRLAATGPARLRRLHQLIADSACATLHCSELCLAGAEGREQCACATGRSVAADGRTCEPAACTAGQFACRSGACLQAGWRCDGWPDCAEAEDEEQCDGRRPAVCGAAHFNCTAGGCVSAVLRCDSVSHCDDGSDERDCDSHHCAAGEFRCGTGYCVPAHYRCDGQNDCTDASDERQCGGADCANGTAPCDNGVCINSDWFCDGRPDCSDLSDEPAHCPTRPSCRGDDRRCSDGSCLAAARWCDDAADCPDGADEGADCGPPEATLRAGSACRHNETACADGRCVASAALCDCVGGVDGVDGEADCPPRLTCRGTHRHIDASWLCDGESDCDDGWDELACPNAPASTAAPPAAVGCDGGQHGCADGYGCVDADNVCDDVADCDDRSDEGGLCATSCTMAICADRCRRTPTGPQCGCAPGFRLHTDGKSCHDVDECAAGAPCWQLCENTEGSYRCGCLPGYWLEADGVACRARVSPRLLLTRADGIFSEDTRRADSEHVVYRNKDATLAFSDYDSWTQTLYFYDRYRGSVLTVGGADSPSPRLLVENVTSLTSLALEWNSKNVYLASRHGDTGVLRACGSAGCRTLMRTPGEVLLALRPVPEQGVLLACAETLAADGRQRRGRLLRLSADGRHWHVLADHKVGRCVGVDLDRVTQRVWWLDSHYLRLGSVELDGSRRIRLDLASLSQPRTLAVFDDWAYFVTHGGHVRRCNTRLRHTGGGTYAPLSNNSDAVCQAVYSRSMRLESVDVVHTLRQPLLSADQDGSRSSCLALGCRHMCLPHAGQLACYCPDHLPNCQKQALGAAGASAVRDGGDGGGDARSDDDGDNGGGGTSSATVAIVLCLTALLLAVAALWLRRRQRRSAAAPTHNQFHNHTFGLTPPSAPHESGLAAPDAADADHTPDEKDHKFASSGGCPHWERLDCDSSGGNSSPQLKGGHIRFGLGARSQDSGFLELGSVGFSSTERLVQ